MCKLQAPIDIQTCNLYMRPAHDPCEARCPKCHMLSMLVSLLHDPSDSRFRMPQVQLLCFQTWRGPLPWKKLRLDGWFIFPFWCVLKGRQRDITHNYIYIYYWGESPFRDTPKSLGFCSNPLLCCDVFGVSGLVSLDIWKGLGILRACRYV